MNYLKAVTIILCTLFLSRYSVALYADTPKISDYHRTFIVLEKNKKLRIAIRQYYVGNELFFLAVDPYLLTTESAPAKDFKDRDYLAKNGTLSSTYFSMREINNTPYMKALLKYTEQRDKKQLNQGITRSEYPVHGVFLTINMPPSAISFEKRLFESLIDKSKIMRKPVPFAVSISGLWIVEDLDEFNWITQQEKNGLFKITWINNSFSFPYYADLPLKDNFLVTPEININAEILDTEKLLLEHNQLPSVFFRFPGLISNKKLMLKLKEFGLIPVGSDAYLAKGQQFKMGDIILVHGNSNEPEGVDKILPLIKNGNLNLLPFQDAFIK